MKKIRTSDLLKVFLRSFYIQGAWSVERMMGLGFCFCLIPIARRLFDTREEMADFLNRHLEYFNSQPYMASYALGAIAKLEEQAIQKQWKSLKPITVFRDRLISPLGAIGDSLFWKSLKPLTSCIGIITSALFGWIGVIIFLLLFNSVHIFFRIHGIFESYRKGFDIIRDLSIRGTKKYFDMLAAGISASVGVLIIASIYWLTNNAYGFKEIIIFLFMTLISYGLTMKRKLRVETLITIVIIISVTIGLIV